MAKKRETTLGAISDTGHYTVPFGRSSISFDLPPGMTGSVAQSQPGRPLPDPALAARAAVAEPLGSSPLRAIAANKTKVCIAVTDATRACPDHLLVPPMLAELTAAGVPDDAVTILVAVGTHRASTDAEKTEKLGQDVVRRYRIVDHDAADERNLVQVAVGPGGLPFRLNRLIAEADLVLSTGVVEPHQYAGYSGGGKTVAIGCADETTIAYTHGPAMLDLPGTRLARLAGNPFQEAVRQVARAAKVAFVINAILNDDGYPVAIAAGAPAAVQDYLSTIAAGLYTVAIPAQTDIAVAGVGYPKDANLYQASRAASYLQFAPIPVVRRGGVIIIPAACPEGAGEGVGERRFAEAMRQPGGPAAVIARARAEGIRPGEQRAYVMARVLQDAHVVVAGAADPESVHSLGFLTAPTIADAFQQAERTTSPRAAVLVVPHALLTLPLVQGEPAARAAEAHHASAP